MHFEPNALYHIYNRSNETVFLSRDNYLFFLRQIKQNIVPVCNILAWVVMPNHFHLLIEATETGCTSTNEKHRPNTQILSKNIGTLLSNYTQAFNKRHNRRGSLFAHKTKAKLLNDEYSPKKRFEHTTALNYATYCFLYIHQNPLVAGLVNEQEDWEFSSFSDYAGLRDGIICKKQLARKYIQLDFDDFLDQSKFIVEEELAHKFLTA